MTNMAYQGHQGGGQYGGEAASYYGEAPNPQQYGSPAGGQPAYGEPYASQYGNIYDERGDGSPRPPPSAGPGGQDGERGLMGGLAGAAAGGYGGHKMGHGVIGALGGAFAGHKLQDFVHDKKEEKHEEKIQQQQQQQQAYGSPHASSSPHHSEPHHYHHHSHSGSHHSPIPTHHDRSISGGGRGNFSASSHDIHLEGHDLRATCARGDGGSQVSIMNLDGVLSNEDGHFHWVNGGSGGGGASVTVAQGDTLRNIAGRVGCNFEELARRNNLANPDMIYPGQVLEVPGGGGGAVGNFSASARDVRLVDGGRVLEAELLDTHGHWHRSHINLDERIGNENGRLRLV